MDISAPLVDSVFGKVQEGSVLSCHIPANRVPKTCPHTDAPPPPQLPLHGYKLGPSACSFAYTEHQQHHTMSLATTLETAHTIANSTKGQRSCIVWHQQIQRGLSHQGTELCRKFCKTTSET
ncbi:Histidinol-phosphate aminotransferase 1 [Labeo rohita]|uniref:Histidinol-phosphate aminotransferase 1 n=1 Tax=Labeo rohita TaxID=84645 RepID=A0ABQ8LYN4_LABRO|nr:Histidinol-phosphate aminotransferase 1 [Labeo rohita]